MAGSYPDAPSRRIYYDVDGTVLVVRATEFGENPWMETDPATLAKLNSENPVPTGLGNGLDPDSQFNTTAGEMVFIYPELREFDGIMVWHTQGTINRIRQIDTSGDTTNGVDGTFTNRIADYTDLADTTDAWRTITSQAVSNVRAVRIKFLQFKGGQMVFRHVHLYGTIAAGETPDRVLVVDNDTGSEFGAPLDFGDIPRGSAEERELLLRNNSGSLTAASIQATVESLYESSDTWYELKEAGGAYTATLAYASSIGPGADSPLTTLKRDTPDDETLGLHAARLRVSVGSWT